MGTWGLRWVVMAASVLATATPAAAVESTHGVAVGDVTATTAIVWSRADRAARMHVHYTPATGPLDERSVTTMVAADSDFSGQVTLVDLTPGTQYRYHVSFDSGGRESAPMQGLFRTAPDADAAASVALIWAGDLAGQRYCRRPGIGYRIFEPMRRFRADFFVANGDMIYADNDCPSDGIEPGWRNVPGEFPGIGDPSVDWEDPAALRDVFDAHWRYNREDEHFQAFLAATPMYVQWDDHEVINDFGAPWQTYPPQPNRAGYPNVVAAGRRSMFDYHPIANDERIYRRVRWGALVELFILDARSYRSENRRPDDAGKTMLGKTQLEWLKTSLAGSDATWKIISSDVPLAVPTGSRADEFGRDAFAGGATETGFEREALELVRFLDESDVGNVVFIATDVHSAAQLRYERDYDGDGDELLFHELISGPLSAVKGPTPVALDATLGPVMVYGEGGFFNYGTIRVEAGRNGELRADVRDEFGNVRPGSSLTLVPR